MPKNTMTNIYVCSRVNSISKYVMPWKFTMSGDVNKKCGAQNSFIKQGLFVTKNKQLI